MSTPTLEELFPGNIGRLQLIRVMLRLKNPRIFSLPKSEPLPKELLDAILEAKRIDESS